MRMISKKNTK